MKPFGLFTVLALYLLMCRCAQSPPSCSQSPDFFEAQCSAVFASDAWRPRTFSSITSDSFRAFFQKFPTASIQAEVHGGARHWRIGYPDRDGGESFDLTYKEGDGLGAYRASDTLTFVWYLGSAYGWDGHNLLAVTPSGIHSIGQRMWRMPRIYEGPSQWIFVEGNGFPHRMLFYVVPKTLEQITYAAFKPTGQSNPTAWPLADTLAIPRFWAAPDSIGLTLNYYYWGGNRRYSCLPRWTGAERFRLSPLGGSPSDTGALHSRYVACSFFVPEPFLRKN